MKYSLVNTLIAGLPIDLKRFGLGILYPPTIKEMISLQKDNEDITFFFSLVEHSYWTLSKKEKNLPSKFEYALALTSLNNSQKNYMQSFIEALSILYKFDLKEDDCFSVETIDGDICIYLKKPKVIINKKNFNILSEVILNIFYINIKDMHKEYEDEKDIEFVEVTGTAEEKKKIKFFKELAKKKREDEARKRRKKAPLIYDYINYYLLFNRCSYDEALNLTFFQLLNSFEKIMEYENYQELLKYNLSFKFDMSKEKPLVHWTKNFNLDKDRFKNI